MRSKLLVGLVLISSLAFANQDSNTGKESSENAASFSTHDASNQVTEMSANPLSQRLILAQSCTQSQRTSCDYQRATCYSVVFSPDADGQRQKREYQERCERDYNACMRSAGCP